MATFYNQATLTLGTAVTNSNVTEGEIISGVSITKTAVSTSYSADGNIVYIVNITGLCGRAVSDITFTDDLGAYIPDGGSETVVPLDYVEGSLLYFQNGVLQPAPEVVAGPPLSVSGLTLGAGETVTLVYETAVNGFAPLEAGACITNTATVRAGAEDCASASATVCAEQGARLSIAKALYPPTVCENGTLTYTFIIQNSGNLEVVATDNAILSDLFNPILRDITVTLNGAELEEGEGYSYDEATGQFRTLDGVISVPAASFVRDAASGAVTVTPGVAIVTVTGRV